MTEIFTKPLSIKSYHKWDKQQKISAHNNLVNVIPNTMPYTFKDRCNILNIMEYLSTNDLGRAIAVYKFYDMSNSYNAAEFSFEEAQKQTFTKNSIS